MIEPIGYKLNPKKLQKAPQSILPYVCGAFYYTENYEYFDVIKPYLDIPEKPKTLEEISQEFDEKIDKQIEKVKNNYRMSYDWVIAKEKYENFCEKQNDDFNYARDNGSFPLKLMGTLDYSKLSATGSNITSNFVIKEGGKEVGYYTFGNGYLKYYMNKKPTAIVRFFMNKLLGFRWIDT